MNGLQINWDETGKVPVVIQDWLSNKILTFGYMGQEDLAKIRETKRVSLNDACSPQVMEFESIWVNCHSNALLIRVTPVGLICKPDKRSCFTMLPSSD